MPPRCINPPSAARLFVQLSAGARQSSSILEVFLPRQQQIRHLRTVTTVQHPRSSNPSVHHRAVRHHASLESASSRSFARRAFSSTSSRRRTQAIRNPQVDEEGKEMMLEITPRAAQRLTKIMEKDENPYLALRIQVESGGCHGFQYRMGLVTLPQSLAPSSEASIPDEPSPEAEAEMAPSTTTTTSTDSLQQELTEDDTIFAFAKDDAPVEEGSEEALATAPKIVLDVPSLDLLKGSKLDFTMELIGSQFKIVDNPAASSSCGCGTSFDIKM
ncbi:hypothetical protein PFICI_12359 [Pestalotiopsis fici W106-1]|uniref:Core domain-containing protein n=1 Tax=Pestalotiopsis fici (strain W106-1 / CGMCC3.15140) TaxID=1229662 RepID=W3WNC6_PESFW|nr:uncharacterized protein PFICI_12359 [Pestalotiopsis fici W106-1]ETS75415.1 hypothetical protein PFICI_12359 [Pestalotiopsis fici W106-1]